MAKSAFQSKSQSKKATAVQKRAEIVVQEKTCNSVTTSISQGPFEVPVVTMRSKKKSGAAQRKAKAARYRAAAEANLENANAMATLKAEKIPLPKSIQELKKLYENTAELKLTQQLNCDQLLEMLMCFQAKSIDITELGTTDWILQDTNGKFLSDNDKKMAAEAYKQYKAYQAICEALALAQCAERAEGAVAEAAEAQRIFGIVPHVMASNSFKGWYKAKYSKGRRSSPNQQSPPQLLNGGIFSSDFDFKIVNEAPKFEKVSPILAPKMEFSADAFGMPDTSFQDPVSSSDLTTTILPPQLVADAEDTEETVPVKTIAGLPPIVELELSACSVEILSPLQSPMSSPNVDGPVMTINEDVSVSDMDESGAFSEHAKDGSTIVAIFKPLTSAVGSPVLSATETSDFENSQQVQSETDACPATNSFSTLSAQEEQEQTNTMAKYLPLATVVVDKGAIVFPEAMDCVPPRTISMLKGTVADHFLQFGTSMSLSGILRTLVQPKKLIEEERGLPVATNVQALVPYDPLLAQTHADTPALDVPQNNPKTEPAPLASTSPTSVGSEHVLHTSSDWYSDDTTPEMTEVSLPVADTSNPNGYSDDEIQAYAEAMEPYIHLRDPSIKLSAAPEATQRQEIARHCDAAEVGIYNLRDFFAELGDSSPGKSSRAQVVTAFMMLSSREREELDLGAAHIADAATVLVNKRLQHKIKLGSIKLAEFLKGIEFRDDETAHVAIVKKFEECAVKDAEVEEVDARLLEVGREMGWGV